MKKKEMQIFLFVSMLRFVEFTFTSNKINNNKKKPFNSLRIRGLRWNIHVTEHIQEHLYTYIKKHEMFLT